MTEYTIRLILNVDKKRESYYNERNHTDGKQAVKRGRSRCGDEKNEQTEQAHTDFYLLSPIFGEASIFMYSIRFGSSAARSINPSSEFSAASGLID